MKNIIHVSSHFQVPLTEKQWKALTALDKTAKEIHFNAEGNETKEIKKLMKNGCCDIEWNGHFGRNIYFYAETEHIQQAKEAMMKFLNILDNQ